MYIEKHQNAAGCKITVTTTATGLFDLINTAASTTLVNAGFSSKVNAINLTVEDGDIRVLFDGNTPTGTNGILLSSGNVYYFRGVPLDKMKLIRITANVVCSVEVGHSDASESTSASAFDVKLEAGDIQIGAVELKDGTTDARAIINAANTARVATDNVVLVQPINAAGVVISPATGLAEDTAHVTGDIGTEILAVRRDTAASSTVTDGDYATINTDSTGRVWTNTELPDAAALADATANPTQPGVGANVSGFNGTTWDRIRTGLTAAVTSVVGYMNTLPFAKYNATAPAPTDGQSVVLQADSAGNLKETLATLIAGEDGSNNVLATVQRKLASSTYAPLLFKNLAANDTLNVKATPGNVFSFACYNTTASARFFQLHNTATVPGAAAVPYMASFLVPAGSQTVIGSDFFTNEGINFTTGIAYGVSTAAATWDDLAANGDCHITINYI